MTHLDRNLLGSDRLLDEWVSRLGQELADIDRQSSEARAGSDGSLRGACRARIAATSGALRADYLAAIAERPARPVGRRGLAGYRRWRHGRRMMRFRLVVRQALDELARMDAALAPELVAVSSGADSAAIP